MKIEDFIFGCALLFILTMAAIGLFNTLEQFI